MTKNKKLGLAFGAFGVLMFGFAFANVPAFKLFCQKLGFGLSPNNTEAKVADAALGSNRKVEVLFMGVVAGGDEQSGVGHTLGDGRDRGRIAAPP